MRRVETVIIGGGPAGSSCAWELRRRGRECVILERQALPKFKLCAGWITPRVLQSLELNPADYPHGLETLRRMRVYLGGSRARLEYTTLQYSIRRTQFDGWLLQRSGAEVVRHAVRRIVRDEDGFVVDDLWRCRYLVGAGGTNCPVKRSFFAADRGRLVLTQEVEFDAVPRDPVCTLFFPFAGLAGYGWYVPKADGVNIGYGGVAGRLRVNVKAYWESFVDILRRRGLIDGAPPPPASHPYYIGDRRKTVFASGAFITGDAAGLATADMGEGIGPAVESGLRAARHIAGGPTYDVSRIPLFTLPGPAGRLIAGL